MMMVMFVVVVRVCPTLVTSTECLDLNNWTVGVYSGNVVVAARRYVLPIFCQSLLTESIV